MPLQVADELETVVTTEAISAWRAWTLTGRLDGGRLRLRPVAGRTHAWPPRKPARATCKLSTRVHRAPVLECSCGLHGTHGTDILRRTKSPSVLGRAALWGRVVEHEHGYRAEFAYPERLRLVCLLCFAQWGAGTERPDLVDAFAWGRLIPFCQRHHELAIRFGLKPRATVTARAIEEALLSTYAVDRLAV